MEKIVLLFVVAALPLIIHVKFIEFPIEVIRAFRISPLQADIFNWYKNWTLYCSAGLLALLGLKPAPPFFQRCILLYLALVMVSSVSSDFPGVTWLGMPNYMEGALAIASYCALFSAAQSLPPPSLVMPIGFCTVVMFVVCAMQYFSPAFFMKAMHWIVFGNHHEYQMAMETWPLFGTIMNSNVLGTFAAICYPTFLARRRWFLTLLSVLIAVGCQSRGAWVAMFVSTLYLGCKYRRWWLAVPLAFFALGVWVVNVHPTNGGMKWSTVSSGRIYVWRNTMKLLGPHHLLYGNGPAAFALEFPQGDAVGKRAQGWAPEANVDRPHNFYLQVLHASGAVSLLALLVLFAGFLLESKEVAINASVLSYLVNVFFTDSCTSVAPLFWIFLGTGVGRIKKGRIQNERPFGIEPRTRNG